MTKIVVRLPEPKKEYSEDNQRQINRALNSIRTTWIDSIVYPKQYAKQFN